MHRPYKGEVLLIPTSLYAGEMSACASRVFVGRMTDLRGAGS
jgi:hypothetical protein